MPTCLLRTVLPSLLGCGLALQIAHAEIYTWVDPSGVVNLSNEAPPEGVRVTRVTHEPPPRIAAATAAAREAARQAELQALADRARELEVQALSDRVRQLEREVELGRSQAAAAPYPPMPAASFAQYAPEPVQPANTGCDPAWAGCGLWWGSGFYGPGVVVVGVPNGRRFHRHPFRDGQHGVLPRPLPLPIQPLQMSSAAPTVPRGGPRRH